MDAPRTSSRRNLSLGNSPVPKPAFFDKAARDLTETQARDCVAYLVDQGVFTLKKGMYGDPPVLPPVEPRYQGLYAGVTVERTVNNVTFVNVGNTTDGYIVGPGWRMLMVVYRLALL